MRLQWSSTDLRGSEDSSIKEGSQDPVKKVTVVTMKEKMEMVKEGIETAKMELKTIQNEVEEKKLRRNRKRNGNVLMQKQKVI